MNDSELTAKIRKLLTLAADKAAQPGEVAAAAAKAQALLFQYNLSMADVTARGADDVDGYERVDQTLRCPQQWRSWHLSLLAAVGRTNFCRVVKIGGDRCAIIGQRHNLDLAWWLYEHVSSELTRLGRAAVPPEANRRVWIRAFCLGAVRVVYERLKAQRRQDEAVSASSTALVRVTDGQLEAALRKYFGQTHTMRGASVRRRDGDAYAQGIAAGQRLSLNRPIHGAPAPFALQ